ncbi:uncharacterized protein BO95DRAFT_409701 [Aspergillus brunneoviolaceus CBS 621.78]|uniref:Uncharacterized protein n=1 Tax=Aspergillus brunneoviolaceus CBS 621.78 TaxID=1450534 RepID=A0ACD1GET1_9EURO|nr:hypothetical protein BO95DRAFT_409701 [Aspergillus brunneoviolaceus CBS 621.78]RAH47756.1 hypothetical protein BO95DRAFT_409701 [Aspergillus brunneoviolaceus CBS 621.78]
MKSATGDDGTTVATRTSIPVSIPGYSGAYNRGPYTDTFSPPITCRQSATMYTADDGAGAAAGTIYYGHWWSGDMACYPTGTIPATSYTQFQFWYSYYCHPGYYCPSSWHTAATLADGWAGETLTGSRNGVLCCPSGLTLYNNWTHACATSVSPGDVITLVTNFVALETTISSSSVLFQDGIPLIRDETITATNNPSRSNKEYFDWFLDSCQSGDWSGCNPRGGPSRRCGIILFHLLSTAQKTTFAARSILRSARLCPGASLEIVSEACRAFCASVCERARNPSSCE